MSSPAQSAPEEPAADPDRGGARPDQQTDQQTGASTSVRATRTVAAPVERVWELLISPAGTEALLGPGAALGNKGEPWRSGDGSHGVVRSYHALEQLRVSWHADDDAPASLVDLHLVRDEAGTRLDLVHEKLPGDAPGDLQSRWEKALDRLAEKAAR